METIKTVLDKTIKLLQPVTDSALLDVEILLSKVLEKDRSYLRAWPERELSLEEIAKVNHLTEQRRQGQPIAYLTGVKEFWSREFMVTPDVLIPRPETELLVELAFRLIPTDRPCKIIDLGTGSGIISITLAKERPNAEIIATDISQAALAVARQNASRHQAKSIQFMQSHWFDDVPPGKFDLIVSNPPYVAADDPHLQQGDLRFEPLTALISGANGLADIKVIAENASQRLAHGGYLVFEHGYHHGDAVQNLLHSLRFCNIQTHNDLAGQPRVSMAQRLPPN